MPWRRFLSDLNNIQPEIIGVSRDSNDVELSLYVSQNLDCFKGHFPQTPILPGVVQLDWAIHFTKIYFELIDRELSHVEVLKYKAVIAPKSRIKMQLQQKSEVKYCFKIYSESQDHASGRLVFKQQS